MNTMTLRSVFIMTLVVAVLAGAGTASAAESGLYLGALAGKASFEYKDFEDDFEDNFKGDDTGYKLFLGYRFGSFVAAEVGYVDLGSAEDTVLGVDVGLETTAWDASVLGILPIGPFDLFAKAGVISWDAEFDAAFDGVSFGSLSDSGTDMAYGVGAAMNFGALAVRLEYERFDIADSENVFMFTGGITWFF